MMNKTINRRSFLKTSLGVGLALPCLEVMGAKLFEAQKVAPRFCALYTANGMSIPLAKHHIDEWSWLPQTTGRNYPMGKSLEPLASFRDDITILSGLEHPNGAKADPHLCSDMWLTGANLRNPKPGTPQTHDPRPR